MSMSTVAFGAKRTWLRDDAAPAYDPERYQAFVSAQPDSSFSSANKIHTLWQPAERNGWSWMQVKSSPSVGPSSSAAPLPVYSSGRFFSQLVGQSISLDAPQFSLSAP